MLYKTFKKLAFTFDPEGAHDLTIKLMQLAPPLAELYGGQRGDLSGGRYTLKTRHNNSWSFPIGLAAGLDKNGEAIDFLTRLGFGAIEVGTVTPKPQSGNPRPRLHRYIADESLRNSMGFNNHGMEFLARNIAHTSRNSKVLGVNLGKNKVTSNDQAALDYQKLYQKFCRGADYLVINISSPNTEGLRSLQEVDNFKIILDALERGRREYFCPLWVKIAPDLEPQEISALLEVIKEYKLAGVIATNTTVLSERGEGGVSGRLLAAKAQRVRTQILDELRETPRIELIGVGGVSSFEQVWEFWKHGGRLMQIYSSFIFQGPAILNSFRRQIDYLLDKNQVDTLAELLDNIDLATR
ncbi:MAG: quinone-dependent dihydroorotate dehydrogenase [Bdellovibrionales bacterium]|jgi:dihydroorotate dehydrogenase|nr:quinone-dependent dihydroorotate dehydrogenase [Bdellovibrionales bacterium]MBT3524838.1 quinone-dependent dihydroorotate dehydrogenase [Bdellovibrionales bacterium]MBT7669214.1 quinone-dependent dihydroorotate dehydrogenase [Bdellovibrionales bacterium]MBT7767201.1 quinone-dependent dihydroorotate dehydrogenase [Bdellovibrionales bacterium]